MGTEHYYDDSLCFPFRCLCATHFLSLWGKTKRAPLYSLPSSSASPLGAPHWHLKTSLHQAINSATDCNFSYVLVDTVFQKVQFNLMIMEKIFEHTFMNCIVSNEKTKYLVSLLSSHRQRSIFHLFWRSGSAKMLVSTGYNKT